MRRSTVCSQAERELPRVCCPPSYAVHRGSVSLWARLIVEPQCPYVASIYLRLPNSGKVGRDNLFSNSSSFKEVQSWFVTIPSYSFCVFARQLLLSPRAPAPGSKPNTTSS